MKIKSFVSCFFSLTIGLFCVTPIVLAQDATPAPASPPAVKAWGGNRQIEMLTKKLSLTDDQKTKVEAVFKDQMSQMTALRKNEDMAEDDRRTQMMAIRKTSAAKIRALLTSDQQTIFDTLPAMGGQRGKKKSESETPAQAAPTT
jgi:periplasmic protein CpxP/Spy